MVQLAPYVAVVNSDDGIDAPLPGDAAYAHKLREVTVNAPKLKVLGLASGSTTGFVACLPFADFVTSFRRGGIGVEPPPGRPFRLLCLQGREYGTPLAATLAVEAALCNKAPQAMPPPGTLSSARLTYVALMEWVWISASRRAGRVPCMVRLRRQRLQLKRFSLISLRKQCRRLVPFLFGEANPNPNLKPTWLAIMASRARPDEPEVSRWRAGGGVR